MIIPGVVSQHAEEAAFLWLLRDGAVRRPHFTLPTLADLDGRLEAHLDGLRIAGEEGWAICKEVLALEDAGEVFALASVAFETRKEERINEAFAAVAPDPALARGIISALAWLPASTAQRVSSGLMGSSDPLQRRVAIGALACLRRDPGRPLLEAAEDRDPLLRARALRAIGELCQAAHIGLASRGLGDPSADARFWSAWTCTILSADAGAVAQLMEAASKPGPYQSHALELAARRLALAEAAAWRDSLSADETSRRLAVRLAGLAGDAAAAPWLIEIMDEPSLSRVALEAFVFITGADVDEAKLEATERGNARQMPTDEPEDENVATDPDEDLPWPDPAAVAGWWAREKGRFASGRRFLLGQQLTPEWATKVLLSGGQRHRSAAALELAILRPGQPLFEVRAPGFRQQAALKTIAQQR